ncbi:PorP/SprF family type IX secretion system membrane protein [Mesohalobacter halotolerans]|uniref:Type IX secretion system membrane protein PorP/SprF n=1 Tax=Mesohalobacter halotolerans TaxID=1883405 RepID=A0A4U5TRR4_9FLAO|nr:type IX secretion system membrane protein PorP/SprF [Mesohalobacter halotolerans]MBS3738042.1 type IX secretion system membrane protein PorP/SprF [Psychroflexus sp.]TKS56959.1 type IX secretion system membrane protein PorP/SprF [Mesohalobacter halotolerans]
MKKILIIASLIGVLTLPDALAQQDPQYTQYMYNMNVVNPAYAGSKESLSVGLLYRDQYTDIDGGPQTFTFAAHSPLGNGLGVGLSAISDEIGPVEENNLYADISYTIDLGAKHKLAFGVKAGATFFDVGLIDLSLQDDIDDAFSSNINETFVNIGAGFFFYSDKYYVGISMPNFLDSEHLDVDDRSFGSETQHLFATAGYVFDLSDNVKFKPSTLIKTDFNTEATFDINTNFLFYEKFEIGASYRTEDSFSGLVGFRPTDWLQVGFAYDSVSSALDTDSYEAFIIFDIYFKKKTFLSPRYF